MRYLLREIGERIKEIGSLLWRCFYSATLTVLGVAGLALVPQGTECLRLAGEPGWNFPLFLFAVATWSLAAWYSARLVLGRVFEGTSVIDRSNTPFVNAMRRWLPRVLGVLPGAVLTVQFYLLRQPLLALACAGATLAIAAFILRRRSWFAAGFAAGQEESVRFASLQRRTVATVVTAIALTFVLLLAIWWKPVEVTALVTAPVLLCFALASWILFGDLVLTYFFKQAHLPSMAALPLLLFVVFSLWNDNHGVDLIKGDAGPVARREVDAHLDAWLESRAARGELKAGQTFPVFLVAAEGGGIRAAYWAGMVLSKLQDESEARFGRHLFAISGVSGGSLAGSAFAALVADNGSAQCATDMARAYQDCMRSILRRDFLSPTLGYALYPDMLQRFLPFPVAAADRARAMEKAWAHAWRTAAGSDRFAQRFDQLWQRDPGMDVPSLLLNATLVDGGNRVIASDLVVDGRFPDAYDAFDPLLDLRQVSLGTAAHNSARFSYVSPAGTVYGCRQRARLVPCEDGQERQAWGRVIDGGYFENSGVETVRDLLFAMRPVLAKWAARGFVIDPVVLVISNSPGAIAPSGKQDPGSARMDMTFLSELLAPPLGLFNTRMARATFAVTAEQRDMTVILPPDPDRFLWFGMHTERDTPLGWALSAHTFNGIDALLTGPQAGKLPFQAVLRKLPPVLPGVRNREGAGRKLVAQPSHTRELP
ncbi:MAG: patatin-like phospholipase family protein [Pseudomonadota bacterium]